MKTYIFFIHIYIHIFDSKYLVPSKLKDNNNFELETYILFVEKLYCTTVRIIQINRTYIIVYENHNLMKTRNTIKRQ